jgi:hypothetical protein
METITQKEYYMVLDKTETTLGICTNLLDAKRLCYFYLLKDLNNDYNIRYYKIDNYNICNHVDTIRIWAIIKSFDIKIEFNDINQYYKFNNDVKINDDKMQKVLNYLLELDDYNDKLYIEKEKLILKFTNEHKKPKLT